ncbi:hypothetical protein [Actinophytocola sp.]
MVERLGPLSQPTPGTRAIEIIRTFADPRHRPRPVLAGPSPRFPEVPFAA